MIIKIYDDYSLDSNDFLLGNMGETNARTITIKHPTIDGADTYRLRFEYSDNVIYDVLINDGQLIVGGSLLRETGTIKCQWLATKANEDSYDLVAKSNIFMLRIGASIGDDVAPVPSYEQTLDIIDEINGHVVTNKPAINGNTLYTDSTSASLDIIVTLTQGEYNALTLADDDTTLYAIVG